MPQWLHAPILASSQIYATATWGVTLLWLMASWLLWRQLSTRTLLLLQQSVLLSATVVAIVVPWSFLLAWLLERRCVLGALARWLLFSLLFMPLYLHLAGWEAAFGDQGWSYDLWPSQTPPLAGWRGAVGVHAVGTVAWAFALMSLGLRRSPVELEESVRMDGDGLAVFRHITLRSVALAVLITILWVAVNVAGEITATDVFQVRTYAEELYVGFAFDPQATGGVAPSQATWGGGVLLVGWMLIAAWWVTTWCLPTAADVRWETTARGKAKRIGWWSSGVVWSSVLIVWCLPVFSLVYKLGLVSQGSLAERTWRWSAMATIVRLSKAPVSFGSELGWSLQIGGLASLAALCIAILLSWCSRRSTVAQWIMWLLAAICLALPGPVAALITIHLLNRPSVPFLVDLYDRTILAPWTVMVIRCLPISVLMCWHALRTLEQEVVEQAAMEGAATWQQILQIGIPQRAGLFVATWCVGLAIAVGDLAASILVVPPGVTTVAIRTFELVHYGVAETLAALCLMTFLFFSLIAVVTLWFLRRL